MGRRILIVDDSPTLRKVLSFYLGKRGYQCAEAFNGRAALEMLGRERFDLIILDMNMPVMSGSEVLSALQDRPETTPPILILSGDREEESRARGLALGAQYYMTKPFQPPAVVDMIERIFTGTVASTH
jgi:DNA-binding response OmpR family regulator